MSQIATITVKDITYNMAQASAAQQKTLLVLTGYRVAAMSANVAGDIDTSYLTGVLLSLPEETLDKVSNIILYKTFIDGTTTKVDINSFQGNMSGYLKLLAEGLIVNLGDFFSSLAEENAAARAKQTTASEQNQ